jgi:hypothetical protein
MDPNVVGRSVNGYSSSLAAQPDMGPRISRIFVRGITPASDGNAVGIGMADFTTTATVRAINPQFTCVNALTALTPQMAKIPIHFDTDREVAQRACKKQFQIAAHAPVPELVIELARSQELMRFWKNSLSI